MHDPLCIAPGSSARLTPADRRQHDRPRPVALRPAPRAAR
jgi:hypothetical protein